MDGSMQEVRPAESGEEQAAPARPWPGPRELLTLFTAGWLGGAGLLTALSPHLDASLRLLGVGETLAAVLWFVPRLRMSGFGAMLAVLAVAALRGVAVGERPGVLVFYAAVVVYLAVEEHRAKTAA
jgi:hypothetical protein